MQTSPPAAAPAGPKSAPNGKSPAGRDAFVAEMAAMRKTEAAAPPTIEPAGDEPDPDPVDAPEPDAPDADPADLVVDPPPAKVDDIDARKLAASQKEERRRKESFAAERNAIAAERKAALAEIAAEREAMAKEWSTGIEEAKAFAKLRERARLDPDAIFDALKIEGPHYDSYARAAYARTEAGQKDPRAKAQAAMTIREREAAERMTAAEKKAEAADARAAAIEKRLEERDAAARTEQNTNRYLDGVAKAVAPTDAPLVAGMFAKNPDKARRAALEVAVALAAEGGDEPPEFADVVAEMERRRRAELEDMGIDPASVLAAPRRPPGPPPPKVLARGGAAPAVPPRKLTPEEMKAEFVRKRATGKFEDA